MSMRAVVTALGLLACMPSGAAPVSEAALALHRRVLVLDSHIDTARWSPLLYVFRHYFGTGKRLARNFRAET